MPDKKKLTSREKEKKLLEKIAKAKKDLAKIQQKRKMEIANLACKYGLDELTNKQLEQEFKRICESLGNGNK